MPRVKMSFSIEELHCAVDTLIRNLNANASSCDRSAEVDKELGVDPSAWVHTAKSFRQQAARSQKLLDRLEQAWEESETLEVL